MPEAISHMPQPVPGVASVDRLPEGGREREGLVPLDRNERVAPLPDWFVAELREAISSSLLIEYPITEPLYDALAAHTGLGQERLIPTSGSDASFKALLQAYVSPGDTVLTLDPTYAMYAVHSALFGARVATVQVREDLTADPEAVAAALVPGVKLVLLANPNQPTGQLLADGGVELVAARAAEVGALLLVDEAYHPFSGWTALPLLERYPNLVVTRTFSKAFGLAGLRLGFAAADPAVAASLFKVRSVYDVTAPAIAAGQLALAHPGVALDYAAEVASGGKALAARAAALGFGPVTTATNFMPIRVAPSHEPAQLVASLRERGYLVKGPFAHPALAGHIRVTLGPPQLMEQFADALEDAAA